MTSLNLENMQGNLVRPYTHLFAAFVFFSVADPARARTWIGSLLDQGQVTTGAPWSRKPDSTLNLMFTWAGLRACGLSAPSLASFPGDFRDGMAARAAQIGDGGDSHPSRWEDGPGRQETHIMAAVYGTTAAALNERLDRVTHGAAVSGGLSRQCRIQYARRLFAPHPHRPEGLYPTEHFGFADGLSQPAIEGAEGSAVAGDGAPEQGTAWRPIRAGEFILGYPDEDGALPATPAPRQLGDDGAYVVYRKLRQDVAGFRDFFARRAVSFPGGRDALTARVMGRWQDGTPLTRAPSRPEPDLANDESRNNDYRYAGDASGLRCPLGSHVRRANPRDALPFGAVMVNRHRIIRRGISYGEPLSESAPDDGADRGLLFICFQASISRQFEFVQREWLNDGNAFGLGDARDLIAGSACPVGGGGEGTLTVNGSPPFFIADAPSFVTVRGGEYLFMPGIAALRHLATLA